MKTIIQPVKLAPLVLLVVLGGCNKRPAATVQSDITVVAGKVVATNRVPPNSPGAAVIRIRGSKGEHYRIVFPSGQTQNLVRNSTAKLRLGGEIEVTGDRTKNGEIWVYKSGHKLKVTTYGPRV